MKSALEKLVAIVELERLFHSRPFSTQSLKDFEAAGYAGSDHADNMRNFLRCRINDALKEAKDSLAKVQPID
jgi:hypothetical protein